MELKKLEKKIKDYLSKENLPYWEGVELYSEHPSARRNIIINLNQIWNKEIMHTKLVYELECLVGIEIKSNRKSFLEEKPANVPYTLIDKTKVEAPVNYEYKVKFEKLPDDLKALVIEKGQLYNHLELKKKELAAIGQVNDDKSVAKRQIILKDMHRMSDKIKFIHALLVKFDESGKYEAGEIEQLKKQSVGGSNQEPERSDEEILENEFKYLGMDYFKRKDLLTRLRSSVVKQEQRAEESDKKEIKEKNLQKAALGRKMIAILEQWFEENQEPAK